MKYFLKKLGMTLLFGTFCGGILLSGLHLMDDYAKNMDRIFAEEQAEKERAEKK